MKRVDSRPLSIRESLEKKTKKEKKQEEKLKMRTYKRRRGVKEGGKDDIKIRRT